MILRFLFYAFLIYIAVKLLFDFIIPIYKTTKKVKKGFREMQEKMQQQTGGHSSPNSSANKDKTVSPKTEDYIDFEEVGD